MRASMQVSTARCCAGGIALSPWRNLAANALLRSMNRWITPIGHLQARGPRLSPPGSPLRLRLVWEAVDAALFGWDRAVGQHRHHLGADAVERGAQIRKDSRGAAVVGADQPEEHVLGADVVVTELERLPQRVLERLLGPRAERERADAR